jgi:hypothetical protein
MPPRRLVALLAIIHCAACSSGSDVEIGPGGELLAGGERAAESETRGVELGSRALVLDGFAGSIEVIGVDTVASARITFERVARGRTALAAHERLEGVAIQESGDGDAYTFRMSAAHREGAEVNVQAEVPRGTSVTVRLDRGGVEIRDISGDVEVRLRAGGIRAAGLAGRRVDVEGTAGGVSIAATAVPAEADWRAETNTGAVSLAVPRTASARVDAETSTGSIRVQGLDFDDRRLDRRGAGMTFSGTLGEGRGRIRVRTEVGAIRLGAGR